MLATQPTLWRADLPPELEALLWLGSVGSFQEEPGHDYYDVAALTGAMARYNEALLAVCAERGLVCVDLASRLPADTSVFYDDCHFDEPGSRAVAALLTEHFRQRGSRWAAAPGRAPESG